MAIALTYYGQPFQGTLAEQHLNNLGCWPVLFPWNPNLRAEVLWIPMDKARKVLKDRWLPPERTYGLIGYVFRYTNSENRNYSSNRIGLGIYALSKKGKLVAADYKIQVHEPWWQHILGLDTDNSDMFFCPCDYLGGKLHVCEKERIAMALAARCMEREAGTVICFGKSLNLFPETFNRRNGRDCEIYTNSRFANRKYKAMRKRLQGQGIECEQFHNLTGEQIYHGIRS